MATVVQRARLLAVCAGLTAVALQQAPRRIVGDTKVDLALDPLRFLGRVLHLWDPARDFGLTQNQSYGYLFPMGPFFALGRGLGLPPWLVQRLWWALLLCLACVGIVKLAERLGIGDEPARLVGGVAFALSPRMLSTLGPISVESLPYCLAPWVLLPLVGPSSPRRAAARSGVAVLCMGAVNAAAVLAALPPAALWLLTRAPGPARRRLASWWVLAVLLATCWWVVPLVLLGRYSPPFLGLIESAATTTSVTSLVEVLRGTSDWVGYVGLPHGPSWPAAWTLVTRPALIAYTVLVLAAAVAGLLRRDLPERRFLVLCLVAGTAAVTAGHVGPLDGPLAGQLRDLLDGVLAPFRNVHKFDVVLRLPLVLGLVHLVGRLRVAAGSSDRPDLLRPLVVLAAVAGVAGAALPVLTGLAPRGPFLAEPTWERQAATWLREHDDGGTALLVPGARAPDFVWGSPNDEPFQQLATTPWAVRSAVPLTPAGTVRVLDAVEEQLAAGVPSPLLAGFLARAGVTRLVVRNDLDVAQADSSSPLLVHAALAGSPGLARVTTFGADLGGPSEGVLDDEGVPAYAPMEVWSVGPARPRLTVTPVQDVVRVAGGPESLLPLAGVLGGRPALLGPEGATVVADGLKRHEVSVGRSRQATSATLTATEPLRLDAPQPDYLPPGSAGRQTVARYVGARDVVVSSSASDAGAYGGARPEHLPYAALDGDRRTAWRADPFAGRTSSWAVLLDRPLPVEGLTVLLAPGSGRARVETDAGTAAPDRLGELRGTTSRVTVRGDASLAVAEVRLPGLDVTRTLDVPAVAGSPTVVLTEAPGARSACVPDGDAVRCRQGSALGSEEPVRLDRTVHQGTPSQDAVGVTAVARPGPALSALLDRGTGARVTSSSSAVDAPGGRPGTVLDGAAGTGWRAAPGDDDPSLTLTWPTPQTITLRQARPGPLPRGVDAHRGDPRGRRRRAPRRRRERRRLHGGAAADPPAHRAPRRGGVRPQPRPRDRPPVAAARGGVRARGAADPRPARPDLPGVRPGAGAAGRGRRRADPGGRAAAGPRARAALPGGALRPRAGAGGGGHPGGREPVRRRPCRRRRPHPGRRSPRRRSPGSGRAAARGPDPAVGRHGPARRPARTCR